ncbi:hypothetical protein C492_08895 [Natronococcus jeotgali DSM 18795]|uniref:Uncharacterized protein n=1 Tax=Natronococcus jeotgali DSM 18795 TaxID=1227498 RepID=L9XKK0_9EURY|nr:hypothetical protein C492_08895 [Natronococcus jeotgali DSM 18795]
MFFGKPMVRHMNTPSATRGTVIQLVMAIMVRCHHRDPFAPLETVLVEGMCQLTDTLVCVGVSVAVVATVVESGSDFFVSELFDCSRKCLR